MIFTGKIKLKDENSCLKWVIPLLAVLLLAASVLICINDQTVKTTVISVNKDGDAILDITEDELKDAGIEPGDTVMLSAGGFEGSIPYLTGYFTEPCEHLLLALPGEANIIAGISYGDFAKEADLTVGDKVVIGINEKDGAAGLQKLKSLVYTGNISDYGGNEAVFANFRAVEAGDIIKGRLYRCASPIINRSGRAPYADRLIKRAGIRSVVNLADSDEAVSRVIASTDCSSPYYASLYESGKVIALDLTLNYFSEEFGDAIAEGFTFLAGQKPPFLIHCEEGKDRTGFAVMLLEMLTGADKESIIADYKLSYDNYYGPLKDPDLYSEHAEHIAQSMMRVICGLDKDAPLDGVDLKSSARSYLITHGMTDDSIDKFITKLTTDDEPLEKYRDVLKINPYIAGWLKIDGTILDMPVVYTPGSQNYYLHRALDGSETSMGTLFIAINWKDYCNNTLIYGHNMKNGTAFGSLQKFANESYGMKHKTIYFDTLYEEREYELYGVFYSQIADEDLETDEARAADDEAIENGELDLSEDWGDVDLYRKEKDEDNGRFRYYYYIDLSDRDDFEYYAKEVKERALYDTGVEAQWGDEFITLSTCSYQVRNGRFVVVGVRKKD